MSLRQVLHGLAIVFLLIAIVEVASQGSTPSAEPEPMATGGATSEPEPEPTGTAEPEPEPDAGTTMKMTTASGATAATAGNLVAALLLLNTARVLLV